MKILIADSSPMHCQLLADALGRHAGFRVAHCATHSQEVVSCLRNSAPDVAIMSVALQDGPYAGFAALKEAHALATSSRVIMLLDRNDRDLVVESFRHGAMGVFCRTGHFESLRKCVMSVHRGQVWVSSAQTQYLIDALATFPVLHMVNINSKARLSRRENQVVGLVASGLTNREVAQQLQLSEHTIKNYLFRLFDKLGVSGRVGLVSYALAHGKPVQASAEKDHPEPGNNASAG